MKRKFPPETETTTTPSKPKNVVTRKELDDAIKKYGRTITLDK